LFASRRDEEEEGESSKEDDEGKEDDEDTDDDDEEGSVGLVSESSVGRENILNIGRLAIQLIN